MKGSDSCDKRTQTRTAGSESSERSRDSGNVPASGSQEGLNYGQLQN